MSGFANTVNVVICGGGNGAHVIAGLTSMVTNSNVTVVDIFEDEAERWTNSLPKFGFYVDFSNGKHIRQEPGSVNFTVTKDGSSVIPMANVVIICVPAYTHELYLNTLAPLFSDNCLVVGMPGQPGFEYQCAFILKKFGKKCPIMSLETLPWACRISEYGRKVKVFGTKDEVQVSLIKPNETTTGSLPSLETIQTLLGDTPVLKIVGHVLELTLSTKASIHPPIMYAKWKNWNGKPLDTAPLFYQGVDDAAVKCLDEVTDEIRAVAVELDRKYPHLKLSRGASATIQQWLIDHYGDQISDQTSLLTSLQTNKAYDGLVHPMIKDNAGKYLPNFEYRYLSEDVPYGLVVLRQIATMAGVKTPQMDHVIRWAQQQLGCQYLVNDTITDKNADKTRLPQTYGITTIEEFINYF